MKRRFRALTMCLSMFSAIPCPRIRWDEEARPLTTLFLPFIGAVIGGLWALAAYLLRLVGAPRLVVGAVLCAFSYLITGGIHMDGFADVVDAVRSCRDLDERRRILKDPHVGSFAVMFSALVIVLQFAFLASAKDEASVFALMLTAVVSRCAAALAVTVLRPMSASEYSGAYRRGVKRSHVFILLIQLAAAVACGFIFLGRYGFVSLAVIAGSLIAIARAYRSLGGMSGDIAGYALIIGELCGLAVYALI